VPSWRLIGQDSNNFLLHKFLFDLSTNILDHWYLEQ